MPIAGLTGEGIDKIKVWIANILETSNNVSAVQSHTKEETTSLTDATEDSTDIE